jgi:multidrug efflux pump subunit AcrA (membrane-fusion protein)
VLPATALFDKAGQSAVWVVDAASGLVTLKPVTVSRYETDRVVLSGGLTKGEIVVTAGVNRLREGQKVRLAEAARP